MLRLFVVGFGNVGRELLRLLVANPSVFANFNPQNFVVTAITTASHGAVHANHGIDLIEALNYFQNKGRFDSGLSTFCETTSEELMATCEYDVLVELSTLELEQRAQQTTQRIKQALRAGKHVVTANKGPVAFHYLELNALAQKTGARFLFESTVMDGTPLFNLKRHTLRGVKIKRFEGILNSTTNFLLNRLEQGEKFDSALQKARQAGFVEADATHDLHGWDAAMKTAILCNVLFETQVDPLQIKRNRFDQINEIEIQKAKEMGKRWKFIAFGKRENRQLSAGVQLQLLDATHPFFNITATSSVVRLELENLAALTLVQHRPTLTDTAYGVISDLLEILNENKKGHQP